MANLTTAEANRLLDLSAVDDNVYLALTSSVPTAGAAGAELAGGGYARQPVSMAAAVAAAKSNDTIITFPVALADWLNIVGWDVYDAAVAGNRRWFLALAAADQRLVKQGDQYRVPVGNLGFALA